ncbi:hypothetical protein GA0111570_101374 [Raineyella antarctica]|uniref:AMMECR1 domain-containing protein n=1 Tax=Raineyella antarctica TaxID=1577474 RepID=A0A1G6GDW7_9ACTN|nr:AmmeMemoRadiSam system protein A [Raineyella antarctica]SDB80099.1 hypothetical protein GA0111570_101374 [Raineyella antarctica]
MFPDDMGPVLLPLARAAIADRLHLPGPEVPAADWLAEPGASFVTLHLAGRLRGCIGTLEAYRSLGEDTAANARAAAFADPRFPALTVREYAGIEVEVSVLSALEPVPYDDEDDLLGRLRPGIDGVVLRAGRRRGTFLPQVWDQLPDPSRFLDHLRRKAGLPGNGWDPAWQVDRYTVRRWSEQTAA